MKSRFFLRATSLCHAVIFLLLSTGIVSSEAQTVSHEVVAYTGDAVPGLSGAQFTNLEFATISPDGRLILQGYMSGSGVTSANNRAIWSSAPGAAPSVLVARKGATGPNSAIYENFGSPRIATGGKVGFLASNQNMAQVTSLICVGGTPGALSTVVATTLDLPGTALKAQVPTTEGVAASGELLVHSLLSDLSSNGLWRGVPGNLSKIAVTGDSAPGLGGTTFMGATVGNMSGNGTVTFLGSLSGDAAFNQSIWKGTPGALSLVLREGSTVLAGETVTSMERPAVNDAGVVTFVATTTTGGKGLWMSTPTGPQRLVAEGQAVPGQSGWTFSDFDLPSINASGAIAFEADLKNGPATVRSLWLREVSGSLHQIVRVGATLPSRTGSATVTSLSLSPYALADDGTVTFIAVQGANWGLFRSRVISAAPPVVRLSSSVFRTTSSKVLIRGTVSSSSSISRVLVRPAAAKTATAARGTTKWSAKVRVPEGRSKVFIQAIAADGSRSKIVTAKVVREK